MPKTITTQYLNTEEYLHDVAKTSPLFNMDDYTSTDDKVAYDQVISSTINKDSNVFDKTIYDTFYDPNVKLSYIMDTYYGDLNSEDYKSRMEQYKLQYENDSKRRAYDSMDTFSKIMTNIGATGVAVLQGFGNLIDGIWNLGKNAYAYIVGDVAYQRSLNQALLQAADPSRADEERIDPTKAQTEARNNIINSSDGLIDAIFGVTTNELASDYYARYTEIGKGGFFGDVMKVYTDVISNLAREAPMFILNPFGTIPAKIGQFIYFGSMTGNTIQEAVEANPDITNANLLLYTSAVVGTEFLTEKMFGDYVFGKGHWNPEDVTKGVKNSLGRTLTYYGLTAASEAFEEMAAEVIDTGLYNIFIGRKDFSIEEVLYAGLVGGFAGVIGNKIGVSRAVREGKASGLIDSKNKLSQVTQYFELNDLYSNMSNLQSKLSENSELTQLRLKHTDLSEEQLKTQYAQEYNTAMKNDEAFAKEISQYLLAIATIGEKLGSKGLTKVNEILNMTVQQQADYAKFKQVYDEDATTRAGKYTKLYNEHNKDGSVFVVKSELSNFEYDLIKGLKRIFPNITFVVGDVGGNRPNWEGATLAENVVFIDSKAIQNRSVQYIANRIISHEILHTFQRTGNVLSKANMDALDAMFEQMGIKIDYDAIQLSNDYADEKGNALMTRAEKQAQFYTQQLLYNANFIRQIFYTDLTMFKNAYKTLKKIAKTKSDASIKGKLQLHELNLIMQLYRNVVKSTVRNSTDAKAIATELGYTENQTNELMVSYLKPEDMIDHMLLSKVSLSVLSSDYKKVHDILQANRVNKQEQLDLTKLGDEEYMSPEFKASIGYVDNKTNYLDCLNNFLEQYDVMYCAPKKSLIQRINFKDYMKPEFVKDLTDLTKSYNTFMGHVVSEINSDDESEIYKKINDLKSGKVTGDLADEFYSINLQIAQLNNNYAKATDIYDASLFTLIDKKASSRISFDFDYLSDFEQVIYADKTTHGAATSTKILGQSYESIRVFAGDVLSYNQPVIYTQNDTEYLANPAAHKIKEDAYVLDFIDTINHEMTHSVAHIDGLYRGASPALFKPLVDKLNADQKAELTEKLKAVCLDTEISSDDIESGDICQLLYLLVAGEQNAELHNKKSWGTFNSDTYIALNPETGKIEYSKNLQFLKEYIGDTYLNTEQISERTTYKNIPRTFKSGQRNQQIKNLILNFVNKYGLRTPQDFENFGFSYEFVKGITPDSDTDISITDVREMMANGTLADPNSENYDLIITYVLENFLDSDFKQKLIKDYKNNVKLENLAFINKESASSDIEETKKYLKSQNISLAEYNKQVAETLIKGMSEQQLLLEAYKLYRRKQASSKKEISLQSTAGKDESLTYEERISETEAGVTDPFEQSKQNRAYNYEELANSENLTRDLRLMGKQSGEKLSRFLHKLYNDLKEVSDYMSEENLDKLVDSMNSLYEKAGKKPPFTHIQKEQQNLAELAISQNKRLITQLQNKGVDTTQYETKLTEAGTDIKALQQLFNELTKATSAKKKTVVKSKVEKPQDNYYRKFLAKDADGKFKKDVYDLELYFDEEVKRISNVNESDINRVLKEYAKDTASKQEFIPYDTTRDVSRETITTKQDTISAEKVVEKPITEEKETAIKEKAKEAMKKPVEKRKATIGESLVASLKSKKFDTATTQMKKADSQFEYVVANKTTWNNENAELLNQVNDKNVFEIRKEIENSSDPNAKTTLLLFDQFVAEHITILKDPDVRAKFMKEVFEQEVHYGAVRTALQNDEKGDASVTKLKEDLKEDGIDYKPSETVLSKAGIKTSQEDIDTKIKDLKNQLEIVNKEKDEIIRENKELKKTLDEQEKLSNQMREEANKNNPDADRIKELEEKLNKATNTIVKLREKLSEKNYSEVATEANNLQSEIEGYETGDNIRLLDHTIKRLREQGVEGEIKLQGLTQDILEDAAYEIAKRMIDDKDFEIKTKGKTKKEKLGLLPEKVKKKILNILRKSRSIRAVCMLSSPVSWINNWINNTNMELLTRATEALSKFMEKGLGKKYTSEGQLTYSEGTIDSEISNWVDEVFNTPDEALGNKTYAQHLMETSKYDTETREFSKGEAAKRAKKTVDQKSWFGKMLEKVNSVIHWGLEDGFFGDKPKTTKRLIRQLKYLLSSEQNQAFFAQTILSSEFPGVTDKKEMRAKAEKKYQYYINKAQNAKDANSKTQAYNKAEHYSNIIKVIDGNKLAIVKTYMDSNDGKNLVLNEMIRTAGDVFFKSDNWISNLIRGVNQKYPVLGAILGVVVPFPKVMGNISNMIYRYSPFRFIEAFIKMSQLKYTTDVKNKFYDPFAKTKVARQFSEATIGTLGYIAGAIIAALGLIDIDDDDYMGVSIKLGDFKVALGKLAPSLSPLAFGGMLLYSAKNNKNVISETLNTLYDQTTLGLLENMFRYTSAQNFAKDFVINYANQYIPAFSKLLAKYTDMGVKDKSGNFWAKLGKTLASGIPGLSHVVPDKVNPYTGERVTRYGTNNIILNILQATSPVTTKITTKSELEREAELYGAETTGSGSYYTINGKKYDLRGNIKVNRDRAKYINENMTKLIKSSSYKRMSAKEKETAIKSIYNKATTVAKINYWTSLGNYYVITSQDEYNNYYKYITDRTRIKQRYKNYSGSKFIEK